MRDPQHNRYNQNRRRKRRIAKKLFLAGLYKKTCLDEWYDTIDFLEDKPLWQPSIASCNRASKRYK